MKKLCFAGILSLLVSLIGYAQGVPQGMNYQAVARDKAGNTLANTQISLKISLYSPQSAGSYYTETHSVTTNEFGLFSLVIGQGTTDSGAFGNIPWSQQEIWMSVGIQMQGESDYTPLGASKLYAVPYALYAGQVATQTGTMGAMPAGTNTNQCPCNGGITTLSVLYLGPSGVTIRVYNNSALQNTGLVETFTSVANGAVLTINVPANLGTLQNVTYFQYSAIPNAPATTSVPTPCLSSYSALNPASPGGTWGNISVISQTDQNGETCTACNVNGLWYVGGNAVLAACNTLGTLSNNDLVLISNNTPRLVVSAGGDVTANNNLNVNLGLNVLGNVKLNQSSGATTNNGPFTVANFSPTTLTGTLTTTGATDLNNTLTVGGATNLNGILNVNNEQSTDLTGSLTVNRAALLDSSLWVGGNTDLHGYLHVDEQAPAVFTGSTQTYLNATFYDSVLINNASYNSSSPSSGALVVAGGTGIGQSLYVGGPTYLLSSLSVGGNTDLYGYLHVNNKQPTVLTGTLVDSLDASFYQHVILTNPNIGSTTPYNGELVVAGGVGIGQNLNVEGASTFKGPVSFGSVVNFTDTVNSTSYSNGTIVVVGGAGIGENLNVNGNVGFNKDLIVDGTLTVGQATTLNSSLTVSGLTNLNDNVVINASTPYPLKVEGSTGGIQIQVNGPASLGGVPDMTNDYIEFLDESGTPRGSIKGESVADLSKDVGYISTEAFLSANLVIITAQLSIAIATQIASDADVTGCEGLGICFTDPIPSFIVSSAYALGIAVVNEATAASEIIAYTTSYQAGLPGIYFSSGSGDYAEYLPKQDPGEKIYRGDIVGVKGGRISKSTEGAEQLMVVSEMPIVLGNTPPKGKEGDFEKVAFLGQVRVKVFGKVSPGDYILGANGATGFGLPKHPADMTVEDYQKIVGISWEGSDAMGISYVNTAVGLNNNDQAKLAMKQEAKIKAQEDEINSMKQQINEINTALAKVVPGYNPAMTAVSPATSTQNTTPSAQADAAQHPAFNSIHYHQFTHDEMEEGLNSAMESLKAQGQTAENNFILKKLEQDPNFKEQLISQVMEQTRLQIEKNIAIDQKAGR